MYNLNNKTIWEIFVNYFNNHDNSSSQELIEYSNDSIVLINHLNAIEAFNPLAETEFGYNREEVIGWPIDVLFEESINSKIRLTIDDLNRISSERTLRAMRKDGSVFAIDLILTKITLNTHLYHLAIIKDITMRHQLEELERKQLILEAESNAKNDYISILSHELRTPVASIQGALGLLSISPDTPDKMKELYQVAYRNTERLGKIINVLLELDKLRDGTHVKLSDTVLIPVIKEAIAISKCVAENKQIRFIEHYPDHDIHVLSDQDKLVQVCINLLSNAIKSSPSGEEVTVSIEVLSNKVRVSVEDRGSGIPNEFGPKLFTAFSQADKSDTKQDGLGLGLHLSRRIIDLFGGTIGFIPKTDIGSVFYFELPLASAKVPEKEKIS
jgi:PAS domain S-box-containing protein